MGLIKSGAETMRAETMRCSAGVSLGGLGTSSGSTITTLSPSKRFSKRQPARPNTGRPEVADLRGLTNSSAGLLVGNTNGVLHTSPGLPSEATLGSRPRGANSNGVVASRPVTKTQRPAIAGLCRN